MTDFESAVETFVAQQMGGYNPHAIPGTTKIIHDTLWGTVPVSAAEVDIMDCPLVQRMRFIHQTGLAFFTYPSARHSRFEHSLGVMAMATRMGEALRRSKEPDQALRPLVSPVHMQELRLAGLLHDMGHGFFSHISEHMYEGHPWVREFEDDEKYTHAKAHEIISAEMLRTPTFVRFFDKVREGHEATDASFASATLDNVAGLILGTYPGDEQRKYLGDIMNGPFDADKLDYIARDAYFTGLPLGVDMERLMYALATRWHDPSKPGVSPAWRLVADSRGASALEQVLLSKLRLYNALYHHPKVRAADCMMDNIADYMANQSGILSGASAFVLDSPIDYLGRMDEELLNDANVKDENLKRMIVSIRRRELPSKALIVSQKTVKETGMLRSITQKWAYPRDSRAKLRQLAMEIYREIPTAQKRGYSENDIIVDIPPLPQLTEAPLMQIIGRDEQGTEVLRSLNDETHVHDWCQTYVINKWRGHVFSPLRIQLPTYKAALKVFKKYGIEFNNLARTLAHHH